MCTQWEKTGVPARGRGANPGFLVSKDAGWVRGHGWVFWVFWVGSPGWKSGLPPGSSMQDRVLLRRGHSRRIGKVLGGPAGGGQSQQAPRGPRASFSHLPASQMDLVLVT